MAMNQQTAAATAQLFCGNARSQRGVVGKTGPGRKARDGNRGHRNAREYVGDLFEKREEAGDRDGRDAGQLRHRSEHAKREARADEGGQDRDDQRVRQRSDG